MTDFSEKRPRGAWLVVSSPENYEVTRSTGFELQGIKYRHGKRAGRIRPGDGMLWYLTGLQVFAAVARVAGPVHEDSTPRWKSLGRPDDYPWRVPLDPERVLEPEDGVPAAQVRRELIYLRKWPEKHWHLGFQGMLHEWPWQDFQRVRAEVLAAGER